MAGPNGEVIDLMVFPNRRTPFVKYQGGPNLQFFKEIKVEGQADVQRQVIGQYNFRLRLRVHCCYFIQEIKQ